MNESARMERARANTCQSESLLVWKKPLASSGAMWQEPKEARQWGRTGEGRLVGDLWAEEGFQVLSFNG